MRHVFFITRNMPSLENKIILITGSTDGLGKDVAFEMASQGATILLHGRNPQKGETVLKEIRDATGNQKHTYYNADFSSLRQVYATTQRILSQSRKLDILINNAGIGGGEKNIRETGEDGYELRFTVNYLAHFLLTNYLLHLLINSAPSKIINVVSGAQEPIDFNDVMLTRNYSGSRAYGQSKLALIMFTFDLAEKLKAKGVTVNCLHPASMMDTKLVREGGRQSKTSVKEGTDTLVYVATSPETQNVTGAYFDHHKQTVADKQAYDKNSRNELFDLSLKLTEMPILHRTPLFSEKQ
jgi:NAD(P)-dependent dehydrogenase (short-subunit alcohol dehydrogenase family)